MFFPSSVRNRQSYAAPLQARAKSFKSLRPQLEVLEDRLAPSCSTTVVVQLLRVNCDNTRNTVTVDHSGPNTIVNGVAFSDTLFNSMRINVGTGGDTVNLNATPNTLLVIEAGPAEGTPMHVQLSPILRNLLSIQGTVAIHGGGSRGTVTLHDQTFTSSANYLVNTNQIGRMGRLFLYSAMDFLVLNGGSGSNTYNIVNTGSSVRVNPGSGFSSVNVEALTAPRGFLGITGGTGGVSVNLSPLARNLDGIRGVVSFDAGTGSPNSLTLNDQTKVAGVAFRLATTTVTRPTFGGVVFNDRVGIVTVAGGRGANTFAVEGTGGRDQTVLNTGTGNATVNVEGTTQGLPLTVNGGAGGMTVNLTPTGRNLNNLRGNVTVNGGTGTSRLVYHDTAHFTASTYSLSASSLIRPGLQAAVNFSAMTFVTVHGGNGINTYNVTGTGASNLTALFSGNGTGNVVNVEATNLGRRLAVNAGLGNLTVNLTPTTRRLADLRGDVDYNSAGGLNFLRLHDQANVTAVTYTLTDFQVRQSLGVVVRFTGQLDNLVLHGGSGVNTYTVSNLQAVQTILNQGDGNAVANIEANLLGTGVAINGGTGGVTVNASPTARTLATIRGSVVVNGTSVGFDVLTLNGQNDFPGATFNVTASQISGFPFLGVFRFNLLNALTINSGLQLDTFHVSGVALNTALTIHAGDLFGDTINVGNAARTLDDIRGPLIVDGLGGIDTLVIDDRGSTGRFYRDNGTGTFQRLFGGPVINYRSIEHRTLLPGPGLSFGPTASVVEVLGNAADTELQIESLENTLVTVGNDKTGLDEILGPVTLLGEGGKAKGPTRLVVNDRMTAAVQQYSVGLGSVGRTKGASIFHEGIHALELLGGGNGNRFDVEGVNAGTPTTLNTGLGTNLVRMRQHDRIGDALEVNGEGVSDRLGYVAYTTDVYVNLQTGTATDIAAFRGIRNLTGGGGNNILVGDGTLETITGGTGRNLLISGGGKGQLLGGGRGDILIGGITAYDQDPDSLWAILNYWAGSSDDYATRVANLQLGKGVPQLEAEVTVFGGGATNTLTGNGNEKQGVLNLYYLTIAGAITDQQPSEVAVLLDAGGAPRGGSEFPRRLQTVIRAAATTNLRPGLPAETPMPVPGTVGFRQSVPAGQSQAVELAWRSGWQPFDALDAVML